MIHSQKGGVVDGPDDLEVTDRDEVGAGDHFLSTSLHHVKFDLVDQGVVVDRTSMRGATPQCLAVALPRLPNICNCHGREGQQLDRINLDDDARSLVPTAGLHLRSTPKPKWTLLFHH